MKNNKPCKSESRRAHQFDAMKIGISLGVCLVLGASLISVRAVDTPAQAAARVALLQKIYELDHAQTPPPVLVASAKTVVKQPRESAAGVIGTVSEKAVTPQTAPATTSPVAAPTPVAPAKASLIVSFFIAFLLIVSFLLLKLRQLKLKLRQMDCRA